MKEICGYKGLDGKFYENEKECVLADKKFQLKDLSRKLDNFSSALSDALLLAGKYNYIDEERIMGIVAKVILRDSDKFIEIINQKKDLEENLDFLEKEINGYSKPWWLKTIWWRK